VKIKENLLGGGIQPTINTMDEVKELISEYKKLILWVVFLGMALSISVWFLHSGKKAIHLDDAVIVYEEYQEIYNTCSKLNTDLCNDKMFEQFSKTQRILSIKTQLNRWVEEYNSKSKMFGRQLWKSNELPYQLSVNQFNCY
jgi:hypothetical protein